MILNPEIAYSDTLKVPDSQNSEYLFNSHLDGFNYVLLSGNRSSGKTTGIWLYILDACLMNPGLRVLVCRKEYTTMIGTLLTTLSKHILKHGLISDKNPFRVAGKSRPTEIIFPNGSTISFLGTANADDDKLKGFEPDLSWFNEGTRIELRQMKLVWDGQAGGRGGAWFVESKPFWQTIVDTNPDSELHELFRFFNPRGMVNTEQSRAIDNKLFLEYRMTDNPDLTDDGKTLNAKGDVRFQDMLTNNPEGSVSRLRDVFAKWIAAEGAVFTQFSHANLKRLRRENFGEETRWKIVCDWGRITAMLLVAEFEGKVYVFKEYYKQSDSVTEALAYLRYWHGAYNIPIELIEKTIVDVSTGNGTFLKEAGYPVQIADKTISTPEGIQMMQKGFAEETIIINSNSLDHPDPLLADTCQCLADELPTIRYKPKSEQRGRPDDNKPVPSPTNHACDCLRYEIVDMNVGIQLPSFLL